MGSGRRKTVDTCGSAMWEELKEDFFSQVGHRLKA